MTNAMDSSGPSDGGVDASVLDVADALDRLGDLELFVEVLHLFAGDVTGTIQKLETAIQNNDLPIALRHAHTLKGSASNIGATGVYKSALACESAAKAGDVETCRQKAAALNLEVTRLLGVIAQYTGSAGGQT
jgi:two-component system sensor histidine kinase/response regulator